MAIKYHAGRRIQGLSTDTVETPTFEDDFSSDNWQDTGSQIGVSGNKMVWNGLRNASFQGSYYDLGSSVSETEWELRFTLDIDVMTEGSVNAYFNVGLSDTATMNVNTSQDFIGLLTFLSSSSANNSKFMAQGVNDSTITSGTDFGTSDPQSLGLFYVRVRRISATSCIIGIYSNSDYSTLVEEETVTITSGLDNLQYLKITNLSVASGAGTGVFNGTIDDVKFYNGISTVSSKPTDIQLGSRFEETDTRKIYHYNLKTPTFEDDFSTDKSWVHLNSSTALDTGNGYLTFTDPSSLQVYAYKNLQDSDVLGSGNFSATDFIIRAEVEKTNNPSSTGNGSQVELVITDSLGSGWGNNQDQIGIFWNVDHNSSEGEFRAIGADNTSTYSSWSSATALTWNSGTWFIEIIKNGSSSVDVKIFPNNTYSGTPTATATLSLSGMTFSALKYLQIRTFADSARATTLYHIKNMYYYDGVTTVPTGNEWKEEGT